MVAVMGLGVRVSLLHSWYLWPLWCLLLLLQLFMFFTYHYAGC